VVGAIVVAEQLANSFGVAANMVFLMQRCKGVFSTSHYAFMTALVALTSLGAGAASGHIVTWLGYPLYFSFAFVCSWPSMVLVFLVPRVPIEKDPG
jgi:PAT family beta-lactamase induction signal transducer AmpG